MKAGIKVLTMLGLGFVFIALLVLLPKTYANSAPGNYCRDSRDPRVTTTEWSMLEVPMPAKKAREILDGPGKREPGHPHKRRYEVCGHAAALDAYVVLWFNKGRVTYGAYVVITFHETPGSDPLAGLVPCPNDPAALGCDPNAVDPPPVCTNAEGEIIECYYGKELLT